MNKKQAFAVGSAVAVSLLMAVPAFADTSTTTTPTGQTSGQHFRKGGMYAPAGVIGTVTAINGASLTVTGKNGTVYTVDASNATVQKGFGSTATTLTVSQIAVNDVIAVQGTVSGTSVTATKIMDGLPTRPAGATGMGPGGTGTTTPGMWGHSGGPGMMQGGQKLANAAFGTITNIDGLTITLSQTMRGHGSASTTPPTTSTVTVTTTDTTTYKKNGQADTASDLAVGQMIVAMGTKDSSGNITDATSVNIMVRVPRAATTTP
jgi:hypothetical protein